MSEQQSFRAYRVYEGGKFGLGRYAQMGREELDEGNVVVRALYASANLCAPCVRLVSRRAAQHVGSRPAGRSQKKFRSPRAFRGF